MILVTVIGGAHQLDMYHYTQILQGSLNYPFGVNQTMQMYGNFQGFPRKIVHEVWIGNIHPGGVKHGP